MPSQHAPWHCYLCCSCCVCLWRVGHTAMSAHMCEHEHRARRHFIRQDAKAVHICNVGVLWVDGLPDFLMRQFTLRTR